MSQCIVPDWHLPREGQEKFQGEENHGRSDMHKHLQNNPMSNYGVAELTWENGQIAMHGLGGILHSGQTKPTWGSRTGETLESIVHQATCNKQKLNMQQQQEAQTLANLGSIGQPSEGKWSHQMGHLVMKKRTRTESNQHTTGFNASTQDELVNRSACASASAFSGDDDMETSTRRTWASFESPRSLTNKTTAEDSINFCRDNDTTMMTWPSFQSPHSLRTKSTDEDSACQDGSENLDEDRETKTETVRSHSTSRRSRAAAVHNQSERRRRDRINQKMKALQKLVPNASKTDKASMLDEVIDYLKQLQAQVQMMSVGNMPQMMMPLGMQQQLQMSLLARMGMGVGLGMGMGVLDMSTMASPGQHSLPQLVHSAPPVTAAKPAFVSAPFVFPQMITGHSATGTNPDPAASTTTPVRLPDPYCAYLAQSMNMELYNKMAAMYQHQVNQSAHPASNPSQTKHLQAD